MNPTVIITGATKGLGRALALAFAREGHTVIGTYGTDQASARQLEHELGGLPGKARIVCHDVRSDDPALWTLPEIQEAESLALINNAAAPFAPRPFHLLAWEEFAQQWEVGVKGSFLATRALVRQMAKAGQGTIVNVLTRAVAGAPPKGFAAYVTAKHALRGLTLALAEELRSRGIRVFSVSPGFMSTPLTAAWDAPMRAAVQSGGPNSEPAVAAERIRALILSAETPGRGEDHDV